MTRGNPTPSPLRVIDSSMRLGDPTSTPAVVDKDSVCEADRADDDLVSLRGHELRTPLASRVCFAKLIDSGDLTDDQRHLYAGNLLQKGRRLIALINNAMEFQRLETGHRELDLAPIGRVVARASRLSC
ncbi:MAG TPA: histidine kinase dimerization/phospho-acceptor domain-containing protein [Clostridia bacterium]|nr:histidine kinase dimerization/phospho-acceptor domain-containing protein [Clostridia bacterium]